jgi:MFS family permease
MSTSVVGGITQQKSGDMRRLVFAAASGTVFEWYDFFIYGSLATFFSGLFFPQGNETAAMLASLATFGAGFVLRPFGAIVFGRLGDTIGRKYTFLLTMVLMGGATGLIGFLPTFSSIGWAAPGGLVLLRLLQGLAIGGEFGGAVTYIAEHSDPKRRGLMTSWLQVTATVGFLLSLVLLMALRAAISAEAFATWGWRVPFLLSLVLLVYSLVIRMRLAESPIFEEMKAAGRASRHPIKDTLGNREIGFKVLLSVFGAVAGQAVVLYMGHFYSLQFLTSTLKVAPQSAYLYMSIALITGAPFFVFFGWLSDRIGRKWIMMSGCLLSAILFIPIFHGLEHFANPELETFRAQSSVVITGGDCSEDQGFIGQLFQPRYTKPCTNAKSFLTANAVPYTLQADTGPMRILIDHVELKPFDMPSLKRALVARGMPLLANPARINAPAVIFMLFLLVLLATMIYGPIGAYLVEVFPSRVRYSAVSVSLQFGNGWIGGFAPFIATAMVVAAGDIFRGLWYVTIVTLVTLVIGSVLTNNRFGQDIRS